MAQVRGGDSLLLQAFNSDSVRGRAGFFRVAQTRDGVWWFLDPVDEPVFLKAVAAVNRQGRAGPPPGMRWPHAPSIEGGAVRAGRSFARSAQARLHAWGMNALGPWAEPALIEAGGLHACELVDFAHAGGPLIHEGGVCLPDVFHPDWTQACEVRAGEVAMRWRGRRGLVGYFTDDALGWGEPHAERPSLLQVCLSLEPGFAAYHAAWDFVLALHGRDLAAAGRSWRVALSNREVVRQMTRSERALGSPGYRRDDTGFRREFAHRYFRITSGALRRHDPEHLVLGCRFATPPGEGVLAECVYPVVDTVSWHCHGPEFDGHAETYARAAGMPLLLVGVGLGNGRFRAAPFRAHAGPTRLERMLRAGRRALTAACEHPSVVGYEWARWADEPADAPPFGAGLVHGDGSEAVEHTELLVQINARAERWRRRRR